MNKTWYFSVILMSIVSGDSETTSNHNDDFVTNEWRWSAQNDTLYTKSNLTLGLYNDYSSVELEYTSGDGRPKAKNEFEQKLLDAQIVDDVMPTLPEKCLKITYKHGDLIPGQRLTRQEARDKPKVTFESNSDTDLHTIFLSCNSKYIPLSSESLPNGFLFDTGNETTKWLVINIPGNNISAGRPLYNYAPPSRRHSKQVVDRYTFLLYRQKFQIKDLRAPKPMHGEYYRAGEINQSYAFAQQYKLGNPIAANFFITHW